MSLKTPTQLWDYLEAQGFVWNVHEPRPLGYIHKSLPVIPGVDFYGCQTSCCTGRRATIRVARDECREFGLELKAPEGYKFLASDTFVGLYEWWHGEYLPLVAWLYGLNREEGWWN